MGECPFCQIIAGEAPVRVVGETRDSLLFEPLNPVTADHVLIVPKVHVEDAAEDAEISARTMTDAANWARRVGLAFNLITSGGFDATQSVFHLHIHYVPRRPNDGLTLPWTGQTHVAVPAVTS